MGRVWSLAATCILAGIAGTAPAADIPTSYTVNDTALKAAVAGTNITFTLYTDPACIQQAHQQVVPIETVALVSRLKTFTPKNAPKGPKIDELHETLTGVNAAGNLYLTVTGTGITPVGGACQAQATVQPPAAVVKDANGVILGTSGGLDFELGAYTALRKVGSDVVAIVYSATTLGSLSTCVVFQSAGCTGQSFTGSPSFSFSPAPPYAPGLVIGTTLYYPSSGSPTLVTFASQDCGGGCQNVGGSANGYVPTVTATVPAFTPPFHVEVP